MITRSIHVLAVPDLVASSAFYREVLGFEIRAMDDPGWRLYVNGACRIMAGECRDALPPADLGDHSYVAYLVVEDIGVYQRRIAEQAVEIVKPIRDEPWGMREMGIRTADGHRLMLAEAT